MDDRITFGSGSMTLDPTPIRPSWILEGNPVARCRTVAGRNGATSVIWDCTAGRFNWFYNVDETVYVLEGGVVLKDQDGVSRRVSAGETIFFPAGSHAEWTVEKYIRKVAFLSTPQPRLIYIASKVYMLALARFKRLFGGTSQDLAPMFNAK